MDAIQTIRDASTHLHQLCDGSNWPEEAQSGIGFQLYVEMTDILQEIAQNLDAALATLSANDRTTD